MSGGRTSRVFAATLLLVRRGDDWLRAANPALGRGGAGSSQV